MGTNFYMQDRKLARDVKEFQERYPDIHIEIPRLHIGKTSGGWNPLFRTSLLYSSVKEIKELYNNDGRLQIVDEGGGVYSWNEFVDRVLKFETDGKTHIGLDNENMQYILDEEGYEFAVTKEDWE